MATCGTGPEGRDLTSYSERRGAAVSTFRLCNTLSARKLAVPGSHGLQAVTDPSDSPGGAGTSSYRRDLPDAAGGGGVLRTRRPRARAVPPAGDATWLGAGFDPDGSGQRRPDHQHGACPARVTLPVWRHGAERFRLQRLHPLRLRAARGQPAADRCRSVPRRASGRPGRAAAGATSSSSPRLRRDRRTWGWRSARGSSSMHRTGTAPSASTRSTHATGAGASSASAATPPQTPSRALRP